MQRLLVPEKKRSQCGSFHIFWTLREFSTKPNGPGNASHSKFFSEEDQVSLECRLVVHPGGTESKKGKICSLLQFRDTIPVGVTGRGSITVSDRNGKVLGEKDNDWINISESPLFGPDLSKKRTQFPGDCLCFKVHVEYTYQEILCNGKTFGVLAKSTMAQFLQEQYLDRWHPDVVVVSSEGIENHVHGSLLVGSSEVFTELMKGEPFKKEKRLEENQFDSLTVQAFIYFLKNGMLSTLTEPMVRQVRAMAIKYGVDYLVEYVDRLLKTVT